MDSFLACNCFVEMNVVKHFYLPRIRLSLSSCKYHAWIQIKGNSLKISVGSWTLTTFHGHGFQTAIRISQYTYQVSTHEHNNEPNC